MKLPNGNIIRTDPDIEKEIIDFFEPLFSGRHAPGPEYQDPVIQDTPFEPDPSLYDSFLTPDLAKLSDSSRESLEIPVDYEELKEIVINLCAKNKSPGADGLPYEFYSGVFHIIGSKLVEVYNCILDRILLTLSMQGGLTRLIVKIKAGIPLVTQLRPIALLTCDYKILTKILVQRLLPVLSEVIKSGQLCSVQDCNILFGATDILSSIDYINLHRVSAALVSYDLFKAYDRVYVPWLLRTMKAMGFGSLFINWIAMCHENITTKFILNLLSDPIKLLFSIRQGDPMASVLFVIYIEPLLVRLRRELSGLKIGLIDQKDEDYMDDINIFLEKDEDLVKSYEIICEFESVSGAILNRSVNKSKILGLGGWKERTVYPLPWLKVETMIKVFGLQFTADYETTLIANMEALFKDFNDCLSSWYGRMLPTLRMKTHALNIFAISKTAYKLQCLPLPLKYALKFESAVRKFLWKGKMEYLEMSETCNSPLNGGLGLPWLPCKADALFLKHTCRSLEAKKQSYLHIKYWIGLSLSNNFPDMSTGPHSATITPYFQHMLSLLKEALESKYINPRKLKEATAKSLYQTFTETLPPPKCAFVHDFDWAQIWKRIENPVIGSSPHEICFMLINNIIPNRQRLLRLNKVNDNFCLNSQCRVYREVQGPVEENVANRADMKLFVGGEVEDNLHLFVNCQRIKQTWAWVRRKIVFDLLPEGSGNISDFELLHFAYPQSQHENEIVWLLSTYVHFVYYEVNRKSRQINVDKLKSVLQYRHLESCFSNRPPVDLFLII